MKQAKNWGNEIEDKLEDYVSKANNYEVRSDKYALPRDVDHYMPCSPSLIPLPSFESD